MKAGSCSVCTHPKRAEIDAAHVAGATLRDLAKRFEFGSKNTIAKHVRDHVPAAVQAAAQVEAGDSILEEVVRLMDNAKRLMARAESKKDYRTAVAAAREWREVVELQARLLGELRDREINITNVQLDPETLDRMAEMRLARRRPAALSAGYQPPAASDAPASSEGTD